MVFEEDVFGALEMYDGPVKRVEALRAPISEGAVFTENADPGYGRGVPFWAFYFQWQGSLARVTPLFLCDLTYSSSFTSTKSIRNANVI